MHETASFMTSTVIINKMITEQHRPPTAEVLLGHLDIMYLLKRDPISSTVTAINPAHEQKTWNQRK
jgi:hypothetical protein